MNDNAIKSATKVFIKGQKETEKDKQSVQQKPTPMHEGAGLVHKHLSLCWENK